MTDYFKSLCSNSRNGFFLIAGPCVIEDYPLTLEIAHRLKEITERLGLALIFKASCDKANRTSTASFRGPGFESGLEILSRIRERLNLTVVTDIHTPEQAGPTAQAVDLIQIPAFLCRQTDLIQAAARTEVPLIVKKGQFLSPWDCSNIIDKVRGAGCSDLAITERGASFGYNNLVVDFRSIPVIQSFRVPVVVDITHSVQLPGGSGTSSGGDRRFAPILARAAVAAGAEGIFIETHPDPDKALCDGPNSLYLDQMEPLLTQLCAIARAVSSPV